MTLVWDCRVSIEDHCILRWKFSRFAKQFALRGDIESVDGELDFTLSISHPKQKKTTCRRWGPKYSTKGGSNDINHQWLWETARLLHRHRFTWFPLKLGGEAGTNKCVFFEKKQWKRRGFKNDQKNMSLFCRGGGEGDLAKGGKKEYCRTNTCNFGEKSSI